MIDIDFVQGVIAASNRPDSPDHGEAHWLAVASAGNYLSARTPDSDPLVVFLFALFHDTKRDNELTDPGHGLRAAGFAQQLLYDDPSLTNEQLATLITAIQGHDMGRTTTDPTIGVCWDADRLQLWRVGIEPDPAFLSTEAGRANIHSFVAYAHVSGYDWSDLLEELPA